MTLLDLLDRPIAFHRPLVEIGGSVNAALMLSQAIYWSRRTTEKDGWFYKTRDDWQQETGLSHEEQETARKKLLKAGVWEERRERLLHRVWYRVNSGELSRALKSRLPETGNPGVGEPGNGHSTNSKTTSETTTGGFTLSGEPEKKKKPKAGHVNGSHPAQATIEAFCVSLGLPKSDGELMMMKWNADGWPKNWMDKIRYWQRRNWLPSQQSSRFPGNNNGRGMQPAASTEAPRGWKEWLAGKPEYARRCEGLPYPACPEFMRIEFARDRKSTARS